MDGPVDVLPDFSAPGFNIKQDSQNEDEEDTQRSSFDHQNGVTSGSQTQMEVTLDWLDTNYEHADGVCLPRCVLYIHYLHLCKQHSFSPAGAATFGKILRQRFPKLTTRRLGTRGQSKYHYYGMGIKETSIYYHSVYSGKGLTRFSGTKVKTEGSNRKYSLSSKTGTLLPDFPLAASLLLGPGVDRDKVETFSLMYRTHCQRILDTVISANFEEVQSFLLHFWQGMPRHLEELLDVLVITELVGLCDSVLYKVLMDVLIPTTIQDLPDSLSAEIRVFIRKLPIWLKNSLEDMPERLKQKKLEVARHFTQSIRRQISFIQLAQTCRTVLQSQDAVDQMLADLDLVEFDRLLLQVASLQKDCFRPASVSARKYFDDLRSLLKRQSAVEGFVEWIDNLIDACVMQNGSRDAARGCLQNEADQRRFQTEAASFTLQWSIFSSFLLRDLTLSNADSFGSFHVLHMMFNEYVFLVMETQQAHIRDSKQKRHMTKFLTNAGDLNLDVKPKPSLGRTRPSPPTKRKREDGLTDCVSALSQDEDSLSRSDIHTPPGAQCSGSQITSNQSGVFSPISGGVTGLQGTLTNNPSTNKQCQQPLPAPLPVSPLRPAPSRGGGAAYHMPPGSMGTFSAYPSDYLAPSNHPLQTTLTAPVSHLKPFNGEFLGVPHMHVSNGYDQNPLPVTGFNMAAVTGSMPMTSPSSPSSAYWSEGTGRSASCGIGENYGAGLSYPKYPGGQYDVWPRGAYQDQLGAGRPFMCRPGTDGTPRAATTVTGGAIGLPSYGGTVNYVDMVPPSGQCRQEGLPLGNPLGNHFGNPLGNPLQENPQDYYSGGFPGPMTSLGKPFMTSFR